NPPKVEEDEPFRVAESVKELGLRHVVITMVARDDLDDGGASHLKKVVNEIRKKCPETSIETLSSDFLGNKDAWKVLIEANPEIFNYNIETIERLTPRVRHKATYERTLEFLRYIAKEKKGGLIKSGLMVGLGETDDEVLKTMKDLKEAGTDVVTIGQYLQPNRLKLRVKRFVTPETFDYYKREGEKLGLMHVYSGPFVRSSYNANLIIKQFTINSL
ncbi:MAG: lipoyl synthase, partial [Parachlamydiaceae bacterium]